MKAIITVLCATSSALVMVPQALAQAVPQARDELAGEDAASPPGPGTRADQSGQLDSIVVTGRKRVRAEELQSVPLSVTALSAAQLQSPVTRDLLDVGRMAPNASLQASAQKGVQNFSIRGTGVSGTTPSDEPAVGIFQDGVYWGTNYGALGEILDLEGVEILRGPQGTLFGRNVTGGAVNIRSARPSQSDYQRFSLGVSNGPGVEASAIVNRPISGTLAARIALASRANDGLFTNSNTGSSYGKTYVTVARPSIKWEPSDRFNFTLLGEYYSSRGDPVAVRGIAPSTVPGGARTLAEIAGFRTSRDYKNLQFGERGFSNTDVYFLVGELNLDIGPGTLTSVTGYRDVYAENRTDFDGFPVNGFLQHVLTRQHQISQELRYAANIGDWLNFTAGFYYFDQHLDFSELRDLNEGRQRIATKSVLNNDSYAVFTEADINVTPELAVTLGARYTSEKKSARAAPFGQCTFSLTGPCNYLTSQPYKGDNFSPKVGLSYQLDQNKLLFGSWTRGYRAGGFSLRGTPLGAPYQAETVDAYEAGFKTDWLDRRLRFNVSGYFNKFNNLQRTVLGLDPIQGIVQSVFNAADAEIKGLEVELMVKPVQELTLSATYGYTKARYKSFAGVANPGARRFVRVPENTGNISADYEKTLGNGDTIAVHAGASYTGKYFYDDPNLLMQDAYWLVDASVSYTVGDDLTITAYTRNATDKGYGAWGATLGALGQNLYVGEPRTYGLRAVLTFR